MPTAEVIQLADAVKTKLNETTFSKSFTAQRLYTPDFKIADMETLHVTVVPRSLTRKRHSRAEFAFDYEIDVGIQQKIPKGSTQAEADTRCDELMYLTQEIADLLSETRLSGLQEAAPVETDNTPCFDPDGLREERIFTSVVTQAYRLSR